MAASSKSKNQLASASSLKTKGSTKTDSEAGAAIAHFVASDSETGPDTRREALILERELLAPPTVEDPARRDLLLQRLVGFANKA